ncbi:MAG: hypothetical protein Q9160_001749 [Pyrenula sp. 1 TL-2023]
MPPNWLKHLSPRSSQDKDVKKPNTNAYPIFPPPAPREILSNVSYWKALILSREHLIPKHEATDTALFALYRMYEHLILNNTSGLRTELQRFWFNNWAVSSIPDPHDKQQPERYAVLAALPALIALSFNRRIEMGIRRGEATPDEEPSETENEDGGSGEKEWESVPQWTYGVAPAVSVLKIPHDPREGNTLQDFDDPRASQELAAKNILCWQPHIHFL